jgi:hypothetical protein
MAKRQKPTDALNELLAVVSPEVLTDLIRQLTIGRPDVRRECFEFLKSQVQVSKALKGKSEGEIVLTLWSELLPDLDELDSYGGGSYTDEDHVLCGKGQKGQCKAAGASGGVCRFGAGVGGVKMIWTQTEKKDSLS